MADNRLRTQLVVNGREYALEVEPRRTLLDALREDLDLTGAKKVCDMGNCGACTVLVDGRRDVFLPAAGGGLRGREITTIEGLELDPVQRAFIETDAFQCGFCTPGQIMSLRALLNETPEPTDEEIERAVNGNLCRCGAYHNILRAAPWRGRRMKRIEGPDKVSGRARYASDMRLPGCSWRACCAAPSARPHPAHRHRGAEALPGVHAVLQRERAGDPVVRGHRALRPHLRFVGDEVAAVAADPTRSRRTRCA